MSDLIDQLQHFSTLQFEDRDNIAAYAAIAAPAVIATGATLVDLAKRPLTRETGLGGFDPIAAEDASEIKEGRARSVFARWGGPLLVGVGASVMCVNLLNPTLEYDTLKPGVETELVVDNSYTMQLTSDMNGKSRLQAAEDAVAAAALEFAPDQRAGLIMFGANAEVAAPLSVSQPALVEGFSAVTFDAGQETETTKYIDPNGADLSEAIELSRNILSGSENVGEGSDTIVVITDGTVDNAVGSAEILREIATVKAPEADEEQITERAINVEVIVVGSSDATYSSSKYATPIPAGADSKAFEAIADVEGVNVHTAESTEEITDILNDVTERETEDSERIPASLFYWAGGALIAGGFIYETIRKLRKKI